MATKKTVKKTAVTKPLKKSNPNFDLPKKVSKKTAAAEKLLGGKTKKIVRDTTTGRTVKNDKAKLNKKGTVTETVMLPATPPGKIAIPKKLSDCVDLYQAARTKRLEIQQSAQDYAELEGRLREHLIDNVSKSEAAGVMGATHRVTVKIKAIPQIKDQDKFMKFAEKKGNEDLINKVPNSKAVQERWEAGKVVPGVETFNVVSLSLNKI